MNKEEPKKKVFAEGIAEEGATDAERATAAKAKEKPTAPRPEPKKEEKLKKVSPGDKSIHVNLTEEEITSVKVFHDRLVRIERMLEWLVVQRVTDAQKLIKQPNITDILRDIMGKMTDEKKEEEKEDEVPTDT